MKLCSFWPPLQVFLDFEGEMTARGFEPGFDDRIGDARVPELHLTGLRGELTPMQTNLASTTLFGRLHHDHHHHHHSEKTGPFMNDFRASVFFVFA